jgi:hypothetical protein
MSEKTAEKWAIRKPEKPVHVTLDYEDHQVIELINGRKNSQRADLRILHPLTKHSLNIYSGKKEKLLTEEEGKIVGVHIGFVATSLNAPRVFEEFCTKNAILFTHPVKDTCYEPQYNYLIHDTDSIRKLAVAGFEFTASDQILKHEEHLKRAQGYNLVPFK